MPIFITPAAQHRSRHNGDLNRISYWNNFNFIHTTCQTDFNNDTLHCMMNQ